MAIVACLHCSAEAPVDSDRGESLGTLIRQSGYEVVILTNSEIAWLCPACTAKAVPHIQALVDLLKGQDVYWGCLPSILRRRFAKPTPEVTR